MKKFLIIITLIFRTLCSLVFASDSTPLAPEDTCFANSLYTQHFKNSSRRAISGVDEVDKWSMTKPVPDIQQRENLKCEASKGTSITSDKLEMQSLENEHVFTFKGNVVVDSEGLHVTSDELLIFSNKDTNIASNQPKAPTPEQIGKIERVIASGNVFIQETNRTLKAGRATIEPQSGEIILEDNPIYEDPDGIVTGYRMVLRKGEKKAYVEPGNGERPKVILPKLQNLNAAIDG